MDDDWEILVGGIPRPHLKNMSPLGLYNIPPQKMEK